MLNSVLFNFTGHSFACKCHLSYSCFPWQQSSGDSGANVKRLEQETEGKIHHLKTESSRISPDVVQMLLRHVTTVKN